MRIYVYLASALFRHPAVLTRATNNAHVASEAVHVQYQTSTCPVHVASRNLSHDFARAKAACRSAAARRYQHHDHLFYCGTGCEKKQDIFYVQQDMYKMTWIALFLVVVAEVWQLQKTKNKNKFGEYF